MTSSNGTQGDGMRRQRLPIAGRGAQTRRGRRGAITSAVVLVGASPVFAVMMLTATPASAAPAARPLAMSGGMPGMGQDVGHPSPTPTMAGDMPGMDHGTADKPASSPSPTASADVPATDHGDGHASTPWPSASADVPATDHGDGHASTPSPTGSTDGHGTEHGSADKTGADSGHGDTAEVAPDRPVAAVLGTFGGASSAVMLSAAFLRRKDRALSLAKQAARAARKAQK
jgi:hypothetical protein